MLWTGGGSLTWSVCRPVGVSTKCFRFADVAAVALLDDINEWALLGKMCNLQGNYEQVSGFIYMFIQMCMSLALK